MKVTPLLQLIAVASAFVLPNQDVIGNVEIEASKPKKSVANRISSIESLLDPIDHSRFDDISKQVEKAYKKYTGKAHHCLDDALSFVTDVTDSTTRGIEDSYFDAKAWVESKGEELTQHDPLSLFNSEWELEEPINGSKGHGRKGNKTVYQLIAESKYTTKLAALVNDYPDLVDELNNTEAKLTVFAPTDYAFKKIPDHAPKPSKEFLKKVLLYHVSPDFYPAGRVLAGRTIPTALKTDELATEEVSQRIATEISAKGLTINFYSRIVAINIFGNNGVIHGIDSILVPPPPVLKIVDLVPEEFSTLELGLFKTGLFQKINETEHTGGTLFAPSNYAFSKLGARANAFLFSPPGLKYLKALLKYHMVPNQTLYSDFYLDGRSSESQAIFDKPRGPPRGYEHFDLETALEDKSLAVDVSRYGRLIDVRINGYTHVVIPDGIGMDGVVHDVNNVIIPPHSHDSSSDAGLWDGETELTVEELKERLAPYANEEYEPSEL